MYAKLPLSLAAAGAVLLLATGASATGVSPAASQEIATAAAHAGMAASAADATMVHAHLHHTINCLVGPKGAGYDTSQDDPCKGQGKGAIPDSPPAMQKKLEAALATAKIGAAEPDMTSAKDKARQVQSALTSALGE